MFIDILEVPPEGQEVELDSKAEDFAFDQEEFRLVDRVRVRARIDPADENAFHLRGSLDARIELDCVRCLERYSRPVREAFDLVYLPQVANVGPAGFEERELKEEDLTVGFYREDKIDLRLLIWEQIYLALPMKPLCQIDCRGLCPVCGTNLNLSSCSCVREILDPRLATLKTLLKS